MPQQPIMTLTSEERTTLEIFMHRGKANARTLTTLASCSNQQTGEVPQPWRQLSNYTPKHGRWLNMAEIEIAILECNALSRRLPDEAALHHQVLAVETERNTHKRGMSWQFTSRDARCKLERLYPVKEPSSSVR